MTRWILLLFAAAAASPAAAATTIRIMPPDRAVFAAGQRFDIRVEATGDGAAPDGLRVFLGGTDITARNELAGARAAADAAAIGPPSASFLLRNHVLPAPGEYRLRATTADGAAAAVTLRAVGWERRRPGAPRARNIIFLLGDGMGAAHRTAARIVSRGLRDGKAVAPLAMDTLEVTGLVMTPSLNSAITDSAPGMAAYSTGQKSNNNQEGVFPDNTPDPFDNPRVEYIGELLRRVRGPGFGVGVVTTSDVTDATPAANLVHTANRLASAEIARRYVAERDTTALRVLLGGGARQFRPTETAGGARADGRDLVGELVEAGYTHVTTATDVRRLLAAPAAPPRILGLFHPSHMTVAFDKVGAGRYSRELGRPGTDALQDQPMLDEMTRLAIRSLSAHSPQGFYLLVEGASIDKQAHAADPERTIWDTIEFDNAVRAALEFADRTNGDADPDNDTLVIVTADHECGGLGIVAVGNERYAPAALGSSVRDYAAVFRFQPAQLLNFVPNYAADAAGYPVDPDPARKLLLGWAAAPDRYENWISNRFARDAAVARPPETPGSSAAARVAVANPARDGSASDSDNATVDGQARAGFFVGGVIENGAHACAGAAECPGDISSEGQTIAGHTASDVPLSATGPGALQFTGTYENTDVFVKMLRAAAGSYPAGLPGRARRPE